jgi:outer membrane protein
MKLSETAALVLCLALPMGVLESQVQTKVAQTQLQPVVVVNFNALVVQTNESQRDLRALEAKFAPRQAQLQALNDDIEASRKQLADLGDKLNDQQRASRTQLLEAKVKRLQRLAEDFRSDSETEGQQAFQKVAQEVFSFIGEYARQHGYTFVIDRGPDSAPFVWYAAENVDITTQLLTAYNMKSGISSPQATAAPSREKDGPGAPAKSPLPSAPALNRTEGRHG